MAEGNVPPLDHITKSYTNFVLQALRSIKTGDVLKDAESFSAKDRERFKSLHKKAQETMRNDLEESIKVLNDTLGLDQFIEDMETLTAQSSCQEPAWRPNGNVHYHMRSFAFPLLEKEAEKLENQHRQQKKSLEAAQDRLQRKVNILRTYEGERQHRVKTLMVTEGKEVERLKDDILEYIPKLPS